VPDVEVRCKACDRPVAQIGGGHRKRECCHEACKQRFYRQSKQQQEQEQREQQEARMLALWSNDYLPATRWLLNAVMNVHGVDLAKRLAHAISSEVAEREEERRQLRKRLTAL